MIENNLTGVAAAFEMLLEEIEAEINLVNQAGARALEDRDYDKAKEAIERAERLTAFRNKAEDLRREWENLFAPKGMIWRAGSHLAASAVCAVDSGHARKLTTSRSSQACKPWAVRLR